MDHKLTQQIGAWLDTPAEQRDLSEGALLVLRLSNNRIMYSNFLRNLTRSAKMIEYQLQKYYNFRVQDLTHQEVVQMQKEVAEIADRDNLRPLTTEAGSVSGNEIPLDAPSSEADAIRKGKRPDHDSLPPAIQSLYVENLSILQRMRNLHAKLELLSTETSPCPDSERYPFLKELIELDKQYHENWYNYDHYAVDSNATSLAEAAKPMGSPAQLESSCDGESGSTTRPDGDGVASQCDVVAERESSSAASADTAKPKRTTRAKSTKTKAAK